MIAVSLPASSDPGWLNSALRRDAGHELAALGMYHQALEAAEVTGGNWNATTARRHRMELDLHALKDVLTQARTLPELGTTATTLLREGTDQRKAIVRVRAAMPVAVGVGGNSTVPGGRTEW